MEEEEEGRGLEALDYSYDLPTGRNPSALGRCHEVMSELHGAR